MSISRLYPARAIYYRVPTNGGQAAQQSQVKRFIKNGDTVTYRAEAWGWFKRAELVGRAVGDQFPMYVNNLDLTTGLIPLANVAFYDWDDVAPFSMGATAIAEGMNDIKFKSDGSSITYKDSLVEHLQDAISFMQHSVVTNLTVDAPPVNNAHPGDLVTITSIDETFVDYVASSSSANSFDMRANPDNYCDANYYARCSFEPSYKGDVRLQFEYTILNYQIQPLAWLRFSSARYCAWSNYAATQGGVQSLGFGAFIF